MINKRNILKRMLNFVASYTKVKHVDLLDPIMILFIEALAEEVYVNSKEINNIELRMLEKLADLLTPDISLLARPAHCILHALPEIDSEIILSSHSPFYFRDKIFLKKGIDDLSFYPIRDTTIRKTNIRYMVYNDLLYQIEQNQNKTLISRSRNTNSFNKNKLWLALDIHESINTLKDLSFYIDFSGVSNKSELLSILPYCIWKLNGVEFRMVSGINEENLKEEETVDLFERISVLSNLERSILQSYEKNFLYVKDDILIESERLRYPKEIKESFPTHTLEDLTQPLVWLEVELPYHFSIAIMETLQISMNAFVVVNKNLRSNTVDVHNFLPIIPLETGNNESLLGIDYLTDTSGNMYTELPLKDSKEEHFRTFSLRKGGYERYSKREMRQYILDLIKSLNNYLVVESENQLKEEENNEEISVFIKHLEEVVIDDRYEIVNYILIDHLESDDVFFFKYWTTDAVLANNIKQYTSMECFDSNLQVLPSSIYSLSETKGGEYAPQVGERRSLHIKSLNDRNLLVTNNDINTYCNKYFGSIIDTIEINRGVIQNPDCKNQFLPTKDIILTLQKNIVHRLTDEDIERFRNNLQINSPATYNYRIIIK